MSAAADLEIRPGENAVAWASRAFDAIQRAKLTRLPAGYHKAKFHENFIGPVAPISVAVERRLPVGAVRLADQPALESTLQKASLSDVERKILAGMSKPPLPTTSLRTLEFDFADDLPEEFEPPDELVENMLTAGDCSVFYGDSNSGKTFAVIDLAASIARGITWMGRRTEAGLVIYLAAESPASVRRRLQAYQRHHRVRVLNFAIVKNPIDLFTDEADAEAIIALVKQVERERGTKCRLIVGDTLSRLSAGANENAGQDMGCVVKHVDRIRAETKAHFSLIHHSGKNAANGMRGWSGIRAAIETEIEVTDSATGRCIEITKQRDLASKGERVGFRLTPIEVGVTKWGTPATSCIVEPADAPAASAGKRISEIGGAIVEHLRTRGQGCRKSVLVKHFADRYSSSAIYRELKHLVGHGRVIEFAGVVALPGEVPNGAN